MAAHGQFAYVHCINAACSVSCQRPQFPKSASKSGKSSAIGKKKNYSATACSATNTGKATDKGRRADEGVA
jgi:hypothetical protein